MRHTLRYIILSGFAFTIPSFFFSFSNAQERCATVQYSKALHPDYELRRAAFETWMAQKQLTKSQLRKKNSSYQVPVVVHVIHNGEPIGTGANISDEQVLSQLRVLNEDFTRQNADAADTPPAFASVAGSLDIEFVLAKQDPDGLPSTGIVRVNGGRNGWTFNDNYALKAVSYWDAEEYMNIWVCNLTDQYVGFAQHPVSDLEGLENSSTNRLTDGVVIWYRAFGSIDDGAFTLDPVFNKGRTTTHEVGHFFGLFHLWGDTAGCNGTDYVSDTPNQQSRTQGCPTHPRGDSCSDVIMFQNFLDYTDDRCMNLFTQGQVDRMAIVLENSPRRLSLLTSPGLQEPVPLANDLGIRTILAPGESVCSHDITPVVEVRNYGSNAVTSAQIAFMVDNIAQETLNVSLSLDPDESAQVSFSTLTVSSGLHDIRFEILSTNGVSDPGTYNNIKIATVVVPVFGVTPMTVDFEATPADWITQNFDGQITWMISAVSGTTPGNKALRLNYFTYEDKIGEVDVFLSPVLDLSGESVAALTFDVAHARYQNSNDRLKVVVLTGCQSVFEGTPVYDKAGAALETAPPANAPFTPANDSQWRRERIDLSPFAGIDGVQIAFVGINDWGNNLFIDNISLTSELSTDIVLVELRAPSVVTCEPQATSALTISNIGTAPVTEITVEYSVNGGAVQSTSVAGLDIRFGETEEVTLSPFTLAEGSNTIAVNVIPGGPLPDLDESNNQQSFTVVVNNSKDRIPLRENFEGDFAAAWTIANPSPDGGMNWEAVGTNFGTSLYYNAFNNGETGAESWLVSPVLDFSRTSRASMLFNVSYREQPGVPGESLAIFASADCGLTFEPVAFNFPQTGFSVDSWKPQQEEHWAERVDVNLNSYAGEENVRIAFAVTSRRNNNLYLDNIEFYVTAHPGDIEVAPLYSIYGYEMDKPGLSNLYIAFNLPERQTVRFSIVNMMGQMETDGIIPDVLNQTFPLNLQARLAAGVYIIRLSIGGRFYSTKVLVN